MKTARTLLTLLPVMLIAHVASAHEHVKELHTMTEVDKALAERPVMIKFYAHWCGACKMVTGPLNEAAKKHPEMPVVAINVDDKALKGVVTKYKITALPTIIVINKDGNEERFQGARAQEEYEEIMMKASGHHMPLQEPVVTAQAEKVKKVKKPAKKAQKAPARERRAKKDTGCGCGH